MSDSARSIPELLEEISIIKKRIHELEQLESEHKQAQEAQRRNPDIAEWLDEKMAIIAEIGRVIGSTLNIDEVYERFAAETRKLILFDSLTINLYDFQENTLCVAYVSGLDIDCRRQGDPLVLEGSLSEAVIRARTSLRIQPASIDEIVGQFPRLSPIFQAGLRSIMCVPLISRNEVIGVLHFRSKRSNAYTEEDIRLAERIGMQIAGAIANAQLFADLKETEKSLRLSEERFRRIFDEGPVGMVLVSPDYTIIAVNKVFCELLGYTEQELAGHIVADITYEEDREKSREFSGKLFAGSIPMFRLEKRYVRKDGGIVWTNLTASAIHGKEDQVVYAIYIIEDLTENRKASEKIHVLSYYDSLTGLPNRTFFKEFMKRAIDHANRHKEIFALIYIGLDNFQRINDTLGHSFGDLLLKAVADRLTNSLRRSDYIARSDDGETTNVVSRVGGDEFIVLAHDLKQPQNAATASHRLLREISEPFDLNGREMFLTASIGIALYPDDGADVDDLLKNADTALEHAKKEGKDSYQFYSRSMNLCVLELLTLENDLRKALERNEFVLYYQPKVDAATRMVTGMEALIRWVHPDKGLIPPMQFIPLAETSGLIIPIGEFVIRTVCRQIKAWQEAGHKQMKISLNLSSRQFDQQNLIEIVKEALRDTMIPPQCLELEITESTIMRNPEKAIRTLTELKAMGIGIAIDDFGTGYSSLSHLKRLPLDFLKIDMSFIKSLASDPNDQAIVRATIAMAQSLNLKTIAEGVETEAQMPFLQEHGCDEIQGYLFSRPLPVEEITKILAKGCL